jgi:hypothetical protein
LVSLGVFVLLHLGSRPLPALERSSPSHASAPPIPARPSHSGTVPAVPPPAATPVLAPVLTEEQRYGVLVAKRASGALEEEEELELEILEERRELERLQQQKRELAQKLVPVTVSVPSPANAREWRRTSEVTRAFDSTITELLDAPPAAGSAAGAEAAAAGATKSRVSEAEETLRQLDQLSVRTHTHTGRGRSPVTGIASAAVEMEVEESSKLTETGPDSQTERQRAVRSARRNSGGLKLSSSPSFSASAQADLAKSPQLKRAVQRSPHTPSINAGTGPAEDEDESTSDDPDSFESDEDAAGSVMRNSLREVEGTPEYFAEKQEFAAEAQRYQSWVAEALEDLTMRGFGATVDEVEAFRAVLCDSDVDLSRPNERFAEELRHLWAKLGPEPSAAPATALTLVDVERLRQSVTQSIEQRRSDFEQLLRELRAHEQAARAEHGRRQEAAAQQLSGTTATSDVRAGAASAVAPSKGLALDELDFDISKELSAFGFNLDEIVPAKPPPRVDAMVEADQLAKVEASRLAKEEEEKQQKQRRAKEAEEQRKRVKEEEEERQRKEASRLAKEEEEKQQRAEEAEEQHKRVEEEGRQRKEASRRVEEERVQVSRLEKEGSQRRVREEETRERKGGDETAARVEGGANRKLSPGTLVEAKWDEDSMWYKARIDEPTVFGYWLTFVEYGNSQDTAPENVRVLNDAARGVGDEFVVAGKSGGQQRNSSAAVKRDAVASKVPQTNSSIFPSQQAQGSNC